MLGSLEDQSQWWQSAAQNKMSRDTTLCGVENISLKGKDVIMKKVTLRADLAHITIGRLCVIGPRTILQPSKKKGVYYPLDVGEYVFIGEDVHIDSNSIGNYVHIGNRAVISQRAQLMDGCAVDDGAVVPPGMVVPPLTKVAGSPGSDADLSFGDPTASTKLTDNIFFATDPAYSRNTSFFADFGPNIGTAKEYQGEGCLFFGVECEITYDCPANHSA
ncbi:putative dynactin subunit 5 [Paratrimastix pyriformis]|uniref:Dynactin subunit 5 n=1 Tax=Paratrimastix pyriformis TaxID=342808 RepID=A0ABQ8UYR7_9EUKA|nr:putative dynactin subunit 5 [Paratrimastix pyriformis]